MATMYPEVGTALQDRKRKREDLSPASDQHLPDLRMVDSAQTPFMPEDLHSKRQHLLVCSTASALRLPPLWTDTACTHSNSQLVLLQGQGPHLLQIMTTGNTSSRQSLSGQR